MTFLDETESCTLDPSMERPTELGFRVVQLVPTPSTALREIFQSHVRLSVDNVLVPVDAVMAALTKLGLDGLDGATPNPEPTHLPP